MVYPFTKLAIFPFFRLFIKELSGLENIPAKGPFIIASNHESYLDPMVICSVVIPKINRKIRFIAIRDAAQRNFWKLGDVICRKWAGCIPLDKADKGKGALNEAITHLKNGEIVALFPEGELTKKERKPRAGVARLALDSKAPIIPIYLENTAKVLPALKLKPKALKRIIRIRIGKPILWEQLEPKREDFGRIADDIIKRVYNLAK